MNETYITYEEFVDLCNKGYTYNGFVIGHGYAFPHVTGGIEHKSEFIINVPLNLLGSDFPSFPYALYNVFQYLDTSEEMIKKSYNNKKEDLKNKNVPNNPQKNKNNEPQSVNNENYPYTSNSDYLTTLLTPSGNGSMYLSPWGNDSSNFYGHNQPNPSYQQNPGTSTSNNNSGFFPYIVGSTSSSLSIYENLIYDPDYYIQTNGEKSVWWKQNRKGEALLKDGKKIPKSANAANKLFRNNVLKWGGRFVSGVGLYLTLDDINQNGLTLRRGADAFFGVVAFFGPIGSLASTGYFIFTIYYDYHLRDWKPSSADLEEAMHTNTD